MHEGKRINLTDADRPSEALHVTIVACDNRVLTVAVPNTVVQFSLYRRQHDASYEGSLGGRIFNFVPASDKRPGAAPKTEK